MAKQPDYEEIVQATSARTDSLIWALIKLLWNKWDAHDNYGENKATNELIMDSADLTMTYIEEAQRQTETYMREVFKNSGQPYPENVPAPGKTPYHRRGGITPDEIWERPVNVYRNARRKKASHQEAKKKMQERIYDIAHEELRLAQRDYAARIISGGDTVKGWRRIIHPELSRTGTCGLCVAASQRIYKKSYLMPIHKRCCCTVAPVFQNADPGLKLSRADLKRLYNTAGGTHAKQLSKVSIKEYTSTELGPILTRARKGDTLKVWGEPDPDPQGLTDREKEHAATGDDATTYAEVPTTAEDIAAIEDMLSYYKTRLVNAPYEYYKQRIKQLQAQLTAARRSHAKAGKS